MRFINLLNLTVITLCLALSGCIHSITGNLGEIVSEASGGDVQNQWPDYKIDPLAVTNDQVASDSPIDDEVQLVAFETEEPESELPTTSDIEVFANLPNLNEGTFPTNPIAPSTDQQNSTAENVDSIPFNPIRDTDSYNRTNTLQPLLRIANNPLQPSIPVDVAPEMPELEFKVAEIPEVVLEPIAPEPAAPEPTAPEPTASEPIASEPFVSNQMQQLLPPFANHPTTESCEYDFCTNDEIEMAEIEADTHSSSGFVNELIDVAMAPDQIAFVSATQPPEPVARKLTWDEQLEQTIAAIENESENFSGEKRESLQTATVVMRSLHSNLLDMNQDAVPASVKQYWIHQISALRSIMDASIDNENVSSITSATLQELQMAANALRESADLRLSSAALCRKVIGFGQYESFETDTFKPNQSVLVYCEIENFSPDIQYEGDLEIYLTRISSSYTITDESGKIVQSFEFPMVSDEARRLRNDFFMHLPIRFADLRIGDYELQVEVHDFGSGKIAELSSPLRFSIR